ncbi:MAG: hypothetical protein KatS3mg021_2232 [Fimbriimonadales bacterium]|jgi:hypothetical protein|nr:MAG: hypothetical protein KatS3mg021_2232 [Fimbriimonadales bacterium]CUU34956.1 hypothetical protein GXSOP10_11979 [Armatimonadetes bacterium GXS]
MGLHGGTQAERTLIRIGRTLLAGTLLTALTSVIVASAELIAQTIQIGMMQLPPVVIALLFLLVLFNRGLARLRREWAFTTPELAVLFVMMLFGAMLASRGLMERLIPTQVGVSYYAEGNRWETLYFPHIRPEIVPWDPQQPQPEPLVKHFYQRLPYGQSIPWGSWIASTAHWLVLIGAVFFAFLCISVLLRKQWVENERLAFPLVQLPLELMREGEFFRNRAFWFGALVPLFVFTLNGLHRNIPTLPEIPLNLPLKPFFVNPPYDQITFFSIYFSFAAVGFFFLIPTELLFSFWFFYLLSKALEILGLGLGFDTTAKHAATAGFVKWLCSGAFFGVALYILYSARHHLRYIWQVATGQAPPPPPGSELMSYRVAFWGLIASFLVIVAWSAWAGMDWWLAGVVFAIYLLVQGLVMARCTAEGGLLITEGCFTPMDVVTMEKYSLLTPRNLTAMAFLDAMLFRDLRGITLTGYLDTQKLSDEVRLHRKTLFQTLLGGIVLAIVVAFAFQLWLPYQYGALNLYGYVYQRQPIQFFQENAPFMGGGGAETPVPAFRPLFFGLGFVMTLLLAWARAVWVGFPFHPLGFAMSATWGVVILWFSMLVAWLIKVPLLRYGGMALYRRARPFFLGLIFGEFFSAAVWALLALLFGVETPNYPWP